MAILQILMTPNQFITDTHIFYCKYKFTSLPKYRLCEVNCVFSEQVSVTETLN